MDCPQKEKHELEETHMGKRKSSLDFTLKVIKRYSKGYNETYD